MKKLSVFVFLVALLPTTGNAADGRGDPVETGGTGLFTAAAAPADERPIESPTTIRKRYVGIKFDLLGSRANPPRRVELNLFNDAVFTAVLSRTETNGLGSYAWIGDLTGIKHGQAVLVVTKGVLAGKVSMPGAIYEVRSNGAGTHIIEEIDQSAFPPEMHGIPTPASETPAYTAPDVAGDGCDEIAVLVPYTPEARAAAGGTAAIEAIVALAVTEANQSYINSGITQRLTLVHTMETTPGDAANSFSTDLSRLQNTADGKFDDVDTARETYFADEVGLIIENSGSCGLGYLNSSAAWAFSVTHRTCATGYYSFAHELGHNMSARHDWYVDDTLNSPWSYNKAFVNLDDRWRTVMGYNTRCSGGPYCTRLQYWSNPDVTYGGDPMGVSTTGPTNCMEGSTIPDPSTCAADNRTTLNDTCSTVANFRTSPRPCGLPTPKSDAQLRDLAAVWLGKCVHGSGYTPPLASGVYSDVGTSDFGADWIEQCHTDGITSGCNAANTRYCPKDPVTKAQAVKMTLLAEHGSSYSPPSAGSAPYDDVPMGHQDVHWIAQAKTEGVTTGCDASNFCPDEVLTEKGFQNMLDGAF